MDCLDPEPLSNSTPTLSVSIAQVLVASSSGFYPFLQELHCWRNFLTWLGWWLNSVSCSCSCDGPSQSCWQPVTDRQQVHRRLCERLPHCYNYWHCALQCYFVDAWSPRGSHDGSEAFCRESCCRSAVRILSLSHVPRQVSLGQTTECHGYFQYRYATWYCFCHYRRA